MTSALLCCHANLGILGVTAFFAIGRLRAFARSHDEHNLRYPAPNAFLSSEVMYCCANFIVARGLQCPSLWWSFKYAFVCASCAGTANVPRSANLWLIALCLPMPSDCIGFCNRCNKWSWGMKIVLMYQTYQNTWTSQINGRNASRADFEISHELLNRWTDISIFPWPAWGEVFNPNNDTQTPK